jgi:N-acetylglucosamine-6-sulfatase
VKNFAIALWILFAPLAVAAAEQPNVVVIVVDDMRFDDFAAGGQDFVSTPNIDRLAAEGAMFTNAFTTSPLCSPARASLLTGQYAHNHGIVDNTDRAAQSHQLVTFPQAMQQGGYDTAFIGKWHMGSDGSRRPGFDTWVSLIGQGVNVNPEIIVGEAEKQTVEGHVSDVFTSYAVDFIAQERDKPFLLYLAHKALHPNPRLGLLEGGYIAAERHRGQYAGASVVRRPSAGVPPTDKPALMRPLEGLPPLGLDTATTDRTIRYRMEMMLGVDESVGSLVESLEQTGVLDNTVIIFTSDHGYFYGEHGLNPQRRLAYEETARIPLLIRYPDLAGAGTVIEQLVLNLDIAPTVLEIGRQRPGAHVDGQSLLPLLDDPGRPLQSSFLIEYQTEPSDYLGGARRDSETRSEFERILDMGYNAVRTSRYKYIQYTQLENMDELYDLDRDPYEMNNLFNSPDAAGVQDDMQAELARLLDET